MPYHKDSDPAVLKAFIAQYPFAMVTGSDKQGQPVATQVPVFLEESGGRQVLRGHIMKHNDHHKAFLENDKVLVVFSGPNTYVSGTWYSNPNTASTWNYMSVQVKGRMRFLEEEALIDILRQTSLYFEDDDRTSLTTYDHLSAAFKQRALPMIAGFEVEVTSMDHVFKLSQDRDRESYQNIVAKLKDKGHDARLIAHEMDKRESAVFSTE